MRQGNCCWVRRTVSSAWMGILHGKVMVASSMRMDKETAVEKIYSVAFAQK